MEGAHKYTHCLHTSYILTVGEVVPFFWVGVIDKEGPGIRLHYIIVRVLRVWSAYSSYWGTCKKCLTPPLLDQKLWKWDCKGKPYPVFLHSVCLVCLLYYSHKTLYF